MDKPDIKKMVDRFLGWPLPKTFAPDCGISFKPLDHPNGWPIGTNLFTAVEAKEMFEYVLQQPADKPELTDFERCQHPECGRFKDGAGWGCRAMRDNACAKDDKPEGKAADTEIACSSCGLTMKQSQQLYEIGKAEQQADDDCGDCHKCLEGKTTYGGFPLSSTRMIVCQTCGNKRCPKANNHRNACTGSNEPGQPGSAYAWPAAGKERT